MWCGASCGSLRSLSSQWVAAAQRSICWHTVSRRQKAKADAGEEQKQEMQEDSKRGIAIDISKAMVAQTWERRACAAHVLHVDPRKSHTLDELAAKARGCKSSVSVSYTHLRAHET